MKIKTLLLAAVLSMASFVPAFAQEDPAPPQVPGSFFDTVQGYFTEFNPNLHTFDKTNGYRGSIFLGADQQDDAVSSSLGLEYDLWKAISTEVVVRNAGIAGTILSAQAGLGWNLTVKDVRVTLYADGGYDFLNDKFMGCLGARVKKALTDHTFAGVGLEAQVKKNPNPVIYVFTGFTF